jgi:two-component system CheB/CheR fusion protein
MAATGVATIFLDRALAITRYTPSAVALFRLIPSDLGRPLADLNHRLNYPELTDDAQSVLERLIPVKREVSDGHHWYLAQLLPYRTSEDRIAGVVLSFVDITVARAANEALLSSEEQLRLIIESATDFAIFTLDLERRVTSWNSGAQAIFGYESSEIIGRLGDILFVPEDRQREDPAKEAELALKQGRAENERWHLRKDGTRVYGSGLSMPLRDGHGAILGFVKIMRDLTEQMGTEEAFRIGEEQFRRAIEDAPIPVIMHAEDGEVLQISRTWTELTGYTQEDLPRLEAWLSTAYGPGTEILREQIRKLFLGETRMQEAEIEVTTADGERRNWIFTASAPGTLRDGRRFVVAMALDITDRKRAEEALRESQERLRLVLENATDYAIFSMDLHRRVTTWNPGAQRLLGYAEQEIVGQFGDIIFTSEDRETGVPMREAESALFEGRAADERWHVRKDGTLFWGSGVMTAMRDADGKAVGLVKIFRDQTEQRKAQQALEKSQAELWQALKENEKARVEAESARVAKDHFLAVLSHELRTPLTPVIMAVRALSRVKDLPPVVADALDMIERNVQTEARFIDDLLDVTRIERGKLELDMESVDLQQVIQHAIEVSCV